MFRFPAASDARGFPQSPGGRSVAFTLVELLVVIAIIGILAGLLLPTLAAAKKRTQGVYCMNNSKQLALCFTLYTADNHELFPPNPDDSTTMTGYNWCPGSVAGGIGNLPAAADTFNPDLLKDDKRMLLAPYVKEVRIFKCPADPRTGPYSGANPALRGQTVDAARSISLNQGVGTIDPAYDEFPAGDNHAGAPTLSVNGPWLDGNHTHRRNHPYATFGKSTDFGRAGASQIFLTLDESPWGINDAAFGVSAALPKWIDWPAVFHNNACGLSFGDGHAEIHKWRTASLKTGQRISPTQDTTADNPDWLWLRDHATDKLMD